MLRRLLLALVLAAGFVPGVALAQTCPSPQNLNPALTGGGTVFGRLATQWNQYFGDKVDATSGQLCSPFINGVQVTGSPFATAVPPLISSGGSLRLDYNTSTFALTGTNFDIAPGGVAPSMLFAGSPNSVMGTDGSGVWSPIATVPNALIGTDSSGHIAALTPLTQLSVVALNATQGAPNNGSSTTLSMYTDSANIAPGFQNNGIVNSQLNDYYGDHVDGSSKTSFQNFLLNEVGIGAGQHFNIALNMNDPGAGDHQMITGNIHYNGGYEVAGDEGACGYCLGLWEPAYSLVGNTQINGVPTVGGGNTTTTQAITGSQIAQTVTVSSSTGFSVGEWVEVDAVPIAGASINQEAVQLTGVATGTITGVFRNTQASGVPVMPATVIPLSLAQWGDWGQHRWLVNNTAPSYTTGTISWHSGAPNNNPIGSGTSWSNGMVGGNAANPGCIADDADINRYGVPTNWAIASVTDATHLITTNERQTDPTTLTGSSYEIRPCAFVLRVISNGLTNACCTTLILENNPFTWTNGDQIVEGNGPVWGGFGATLRLNDFYPTSNSNGLQITEEGQYAPNVFFTATNFGGVGISTNQSLQNVFIKLTDASPGGNIGKALISSGTVDFASVQIHQGGSWNLDRYGLFENGFIENNQTELVLQRGGGPNAGAIELDPVWNYNGVHTLIGSNITDTLSSSASNLIDLQIGGTSKFTVDKTGTITHGALSPGTPGVFTLFQVDLPFIVAPTGTMANNGAITLGTALATTYGSGVFLYFPANAIKSGSTAGWYCAVMSTPTAGQVYSASPGQTFPYTIGNPVNCYGVGTPFVSTGPGAYTGVTSQVMGPSFTVAGSNSARITLRTTYVSVLNPTANAKTTTYTYGGTTFGTLATTVAANLGQEANFIMWSGPVPQFGETSVPISNAGNITTPGLMRGVVDMTVNQTMGVTLQMAVATDFIGLEHVTIEEIQGP